MATVFDYLHPVESSVVVVLNTLCANVGLYKFSMMMASSAAGWACGSLKWVHRPHFMVYTGNPRDVPFFVSLVVVCVSS